MRKYPDGVELEHVNCPNGCDRNDELMLVGFDQLHGLPGEFDVWRCSSCGLQRTTPRPTPATIAAYYPSNYAPYQNEGEASTPDTPGLKRIIRLRLGMETRKLPDVTPGRMLEIGCSSGGYMELARQKGWQVEGIEFSEQAATVARAKGFTVQVGSLEQAQPPSEPYDVITAWMVLEHLHDPVGALKKLRAWIKPEGYLVALVPDANSIAKTLFKEQCYDLQLPTHLFHYTPATLKIVLANSGWTLERVSWQRNCNTLLWSLEYWADKRKNQSLTKFARWLRISRKAIKVRMFLGLVLGMTRQSGRIEIWARPSDQKT